MPLSMWPILVIFISIVWPSWFSTFINNSCNERTSAPWFCDLIVTQVVYPNPGDSVTTACVISATVAIMVLNTSFLLYTCIAAVTDKLRGHVYLPRYPGDPSLSVHGLPKNCYLWGNQRTPTERAAIVSHCTEYTFRHSVFRKHW